MQTMRFITTATLALISTGCGLLNQAYKPHPVAAPQARIMPAAVVPEPEAPRTPGSLWTPDTSIAFFSDDKAVRRGDTVLVRVIQRTTGSKAANTETARTSSISAKIRYLLGFEDKINEHTANGLEAPGAPNDLINATATNSFSGEGSTDRSDVLQATVSAIVTEVLRNGNLVIYGHQTVTLNNEASVLTVQGIVRPSDIGDNNTIDSTRIANASIEFTGSGVLADKQHPGWGMRIFDFVWPF